ncbi:hypothetical protein MLD38_002143 [Melastoma candidum]|uniref:Uncharacterized protein n=1 Tax=Melastoma candidum TaxID=119954 RepID=A0ACB9SFM1_9MYRT|nr:hypothetical protein MLD38_002143 [Melastoma candidum]
MEAIFLPQSLDREGRRLNTPKRRIPRHGNSHHRSFDLGLFNGGAVLGGGGGGGGGGGAGLSIGPAWTDPYSILRNSNVGDLAYHSQLPPSPWLPLPPLPLSRSYSSNIKAISYPPPANIKNTGKPNKSPSSSSSSSSLASSPLTPNKSSPKSKPHPKKDQKNTPKQTATPRPDPPELPRDSFKGSLNPGKQPAGSGSFAEDSGRSIFILAPPPSSLPLPSFALRPKLGCNTEAAASASGIPAKDTLRRIQRIP